MKARTVLDVIFNLILLGLGICGLIKFGPIPQNAILLIFILLYFGVRYKMFSAKVEDDTKK